MRKFITFFILLVLLSLSFSTISNAYSTSQYSIDIPSTFDEITEGSFTNSDGTNVNVQINEYKFNNEKIFTEKNLNTFADMLTKEMQTYMDEVKKQAKEQYGEYLTEEEIDKLLNSFKFENIESKEISTITKNNYKCFHLISVCSMSDYKYYVEQYTIYSTDKIFTLTAAASDKEFLNSEEVKSIINSFTITNYEEPVEKSTINSGVIGGILGAVVAAIMTPIITKSKNKKKEQE